MHFNRRTFARTLGLGAIASMLPVARSPLVASAGSWPVPAPPLPSTPAAAQLAWTLDQINSGADGLSERALKAHFTADFLDALPAETLLSLFRTYFGPNAPMTIARFEGPVRDTSIQAILVTPGLDWRVSLGVDLDDDGKIDDLFFTPAPVPAAPRPGLTKWSTLKPEFKKVAPAVSLQVSELIDGELHSLYELNPNTVLGIGSSFKLYVLAELARQISEGDASWQELLEIRDDLRSLPNGDMRLEATGTSFPIRHFAEEMIAASDNTATDHLITRLDRIAVETAFARYGNSAIDRNIPLLLTREWFAIKLRLSRREIEAYLDANVETKRAMLQGRISDEALTLSEVEDWPGSYFIDSIEWFASAADLVRVMASLHAESDVPELSPIRGALSTNAGIPFDARTWAYVGYKGGYETGVKSDVWLLQRGDGRRFIIAAIINDTRREINGVRLSQLMMPLTELLSRLN